MARRLAVLRAAVVVICMVMLGRLVQLQIVEGARNRQLADENRIRIVRRLAPRGTIYDRHNRILASSRLAFSVRVVPEELGMIGAGDAPAGLANLLGVPADEVREAVGRPAAVRYQPMFLWRDASPEVVARLEEHSPYLSGVSVVADAVRDYPHGPLAAHAIGYVRQINPDELGRPENAGYRASDLIGKAGVEKVAERVLRGRDGGDQIEVDASGRRVGTLGTVPPRPGRNVWLTLDLDLQGAAEEALGGRAGAVVALDPWTGDILALASHPSYDPNLFVGALTAKDWDVLSGPGYPQYNRATTSRYPPGSVFKIVTAAAALEAGKCDLRSVFWCDGAYRLPGWALRCWRRSGHGTVSFLKGFAQSCNVMFATLGQRVGANGLAEMARRFGLGEACGIDLPEEAAGLVPTSEWKRRARQEPWYPGDTCQMAIGQGDCLVTPLQVAREFAVVANGGGLVQPHLIARIEGEGDYSPPVERHSVGLRPETIAALQAGMEGVVSPEGTASGIVTPKYAIAGKTGTAQASGGDPHAWFAGYAPADRPRLVVAVVVEHGGRGSTVAAPVARHIFDTALLPAAERPTWLPEDTEVAARPSEEDQ
ncbi:MAG: penicillin-binding protein 2 [Armatimonadota bacterium]|nr:MAG: penicillin-binding protein 2 [Armatimonadota bacterium]